MRKMLCSDICYCVLTGIIGENSNDLNNGTSGCLDKSNHNSQVTNKLTHDRESTKPCMSDFVVFLSIALRLSSQLVHLGE